MIDTIEQHSDAPTRKMPRRGRNAAPVQNGDFVSVARWFTKYARTQPKSVGYNIILTAHGLRPACLIPASCVVALNPCPSMLMQNLEVHQTHASKSVLVCNPHVVDAKALTQYKKSHNLSVLGTVLGYHTPFVRGCYPRILHTVYWLSFNGIEVYSFVDHGAVPNDTIVTALKEMAVKWDATLNGLGLEGATFVGVELKRAQPFRLCRSRPASERRCLVGRV